MSAALKIAALKIARFCWPHEPWQDSASMRLATGGITGTPFILDRMEDVALAEAVLIERGLGEAYGRALVDTMEGHSTYAGKRDDDGVEFVETDFADIALFATAPLDVRVRAIVRVIDEEEEKTK